MRANNIDSEQSVIKVKLSGEDYHDIVIDWTDTSQAYEQQVFRRLAEISGIPVARTEAFAFMNDDHSCDYFPNERVEPELGNINYLHPQLKFDIENLLNIMNGNEHFGLSPRPHCDDNKHFYIEYNFVPERLINETGCTLGFCHYLDNRIILNKLKAIVTNDALQSKMRDLVDHPRSAEFDLSIFDRWFDAYRKLNVMQIYYRTCHFHEEFHRHLVQLIDYVPPQLYLRTQG